MGVLPSFVSGKRIVEMEWMGGSGRGNRPGLFGGCSGVYVLAPYRMATASLELGSMFRWSRRIERLSLVG